MANISHFDNIRDYQKQQRQRILSQYMNEDSNGAAQLITKGEFEEKFPEAQFERYSAQSLTKFREELEKAEGVDNPEETFKKATSDLKGYVVQSEGNKAILFVRKKEAGE